MRRPSESTGALRRAPIVLITVVAAAIAATVLVGVLGHGPGSASAAATHHVKHRHSARGPRSGAISGLGQTSGLLPRNKLTLESAIHVNLSNDSVRLPLYPGKGPDGQKVWYVLLDASDAGLAHDLGVNYAPKPRTLPTAARTASRR
jgi:hypothetical protein